MQILAWGIAAIASIKAFEVTQGIQAGTSYISDLVYPAASILLALIATKQSGKASAVVIPGAVLSLFLAESRPTADQFLGQNPGPG